jgi:DNA-binding PucR family transcriptional regulator
MAVQDEAVASELATVAAAVHGRLPELTHEIWVLIMQGIPELRGDPRVEDLLDASVEENVETLLHVLQHQLPANEARAPTAAVAYARRLAQRGVPPVSLIRAYRVGHGRFLTFCLHQLAHQTTDPEVTVAVTEKMVTTSFQYIDEVSEEVLTVYQQERDRWLLTRAAARAGRVRDLLNGESAKPIRATEDALAYRLEQRHLGAVAWVVGSIRGSEGLQLLDHLGAEAARAVGDHARHLFIPRDESTAWLWLPLGSAPTNRLARVTGAFSLVDDRIRVAVGEPGFGVDGFRDTHSQARLAQELALAADPGTQVTTFEEVGAIALIASDLTSARSWVWRLLGDLALDDEPHERLRVTLQAFLSYGTYTATAAQLGLHKNSVQYRVRRAVELLGEPLETHHTDIELALRACQHLGRAMLRPVL